MQIPESVVRQVFRASLWLKGAHAPRRAWTSRCRQRSTSHIRPLCPERSPATRAPGPHQAGCRWHPARADGRRRQPQAIPDGPARPKGRSRRPRPAWGSEGRPRPPQGVDVAMSPTVDIAHPAVAPATPSPTLAPGPHLAGCRWHPARADGRSVSAGHPSGPAQPEVRSRRPRPALAAKGRPRPAQGAGVAMSPTVDIAHPAVAPGTPSPIRAPGPHQAGCQWHPARADGRSVSAGQPSGPARPQGRSRRTRPAWGSEGRPRPAQGVGVAMSPTIDIAQPPVAPGTPSPTRAPGPHRTGRTALLRKSPAPRAPCTIREFVFRTDAIPT
jgi:hypothetical protein